MKKRSNSSSKSKTTSEDIGEIINTQSMNGIRAEKRATCTSQILKGKHPSPIVSVHLSHSDPVMNDLSLSSMQLVEQAIKERKLHFAPSTPSNSAENVSENDSSDQECDSNISHDSESSSENEDHEDTSRSERTSRRRKRKRISQADIERVIHLTQREAAKELDLCLSSFKRQLKKLRPKIKWPRKSGYRQKVVVPVHDKTLQNRLYELIDEIEAQDSESMEDVSSTQTKQTVIEHQAHVAQETQSEDVYYLEWNQVFVDLRDSQFNSNAFNRVVESVQGDLKELYSQTSPTMSISPLLYKGEIFNFQGPWSEVYHQQHFIGVVLLDRYSNLLASNSTFQHQFGYDLRDFTERFNFSILHLPTVYRDLYIAKIFQLHNSGKLYSIEHTSVLSRKNGELGAFKIHIHFLSGLDMHWVEIQEVTHLMKEVVFRNSLTLRETKLATPKKPVSTISIPEIVSDDIHTKCAILQGSANFEANHPSPT